MFKPLLRVLPSLSGNVKISCFLTDYTRIKNNGKTLYYECNTRLAKLYPLSHQYHNYNFPANLITSTYDYDIVKFYKRYKDTFYNNGFNTNYDELPLIDRYSFVYNRNLDMEFGAKRNSYLTDGYQFSFFAPIYIDNVEDLPDYFLIKIKIMTNKYDDKVKYIRVNINKDDDNKNYLSVYLNNYISSIDNNVIYCLPFTKLATYYGIDVDRGGFLTATDNHVNQLYVNHNTINNFDYTICQGFERHHMIMKQILPLSFYFNIYDMLTTAEKGMYKNAKIHISGAYVKDGNEIDMYDFSDDYSEYKESAYLFNEFYGKMDWIKPGNNIMDGVYPALDESKYVNYILSNKLVKNYARWKMKYSDDEHPYIINMSWAFSKNQKSSYRYGLFPVNYNYITGISNLFQKDGLYYYNFIFPFGNTIQYYSDAGKTPIIQRYRDIMNNHYTSWYTLLPEYSKKIYNIFDNDFKPTEDNKVYYKGILYNLSYILDSYPVDNNITSYWYDRTESLTTYTYDYTYLFKEKGSRDHYWLNTYNYSYNTLIEYYSYYVTNYNINSDEYTYSTYTGSNKKEYNNLTTFTLYSYTDSDEVTAYSSYYYTFTSYNYSYKNIGENTEIYSYDFSYNSNIGINNSHVESFGYVTNYSVIANSIQEYIDTSVTPIFTSGDKTLNYNTEIVDYTGTYYNLYTYNFTYIILEENISTYNFSYTAINDVDNKYNFPYSYNTDIRVVLTDADNYLTKHKITLYDYLESINIKPETQLEITETPITLDIYSSKYYHINAYNYSYNFIEDSKLYEYQYSYNIIKCKNDNVDTVTPYSESIKQESYDAKDYLSTKALTSLLKQSTTAYSYQFSDLYHSTYAYSYVESYSSYAYYYGNKHIDKFAVFVLPLFNIINDNKYFVFSDYCISNDEGNYITNKYDVNCNTTDSLSDSVVDRDKAGKNISKLFVNETSGAKHDKFENNQLFTKISYAYAVSYLFDEDPRPVYMEMAYTVNGDWYENNRYYRLSDIYNIISKISSKHNLKNNFVGVYDDSNYYITDDNGNITYTTNDKQNKVSSYELLPIYHLSSLINVDSIGKTSNNFDILYNQYNLVLQTKLYTTSMDSPSTMSYVYLNSSFTNYVSSYTDDKYYTTFYLKDDYISYSTLLSLIRQDDPHWDAAKNVNLDNPYTYIDSEGNEQKYTEISEDLMQTILSDLDEFTFLPLAYYNQNKYAQNIMVPINKFTGRNYCTYIPEGHENEDNDVLYCDIYNLKKIYSLFNNYQDNIVDNFVDEYMTIIINDSDLYRTKESNISLYGSGKFTISVSNNSGTIDNRIYVLNQPEEIFITPDANYDNINKCTKTNATLTINTFNLDALKDVDGNFIATSPLCLLVLDNTNHITKEFNITFTYKYFTDQSTFEFSHEEGEKDQEIDNKYEQILIDSKLNYGYIDEDSDLASLYRKELYALFLNKKHVYYYYYKIFKDDKDQNSRTISNIFIKRRYMTINNGEISVKDIYVPILEYYKDYNDQIFEEFYNNLEFNEKYDLFFFDTDYYEIINPKIEEYKTAYIIKYNEENKEDITQDQIDSIDWESTYITDEIKEETIKKIGFELCYKKIFYKVDNLLWNNVINLGLNKVGINSQANIYKDLYLYRIYKPFEYNATCKIIPILYDEYNTMVEKAALYTDYKNIVKDLDCCLKPMFNNIYLQYENESLIFTEYMLDNISEVSIYGKDYKFYKAGINNYLCMYELTASADEDNNYTLKVLMDKYGDNIKNLPFFTKYNYCKDSLITSKSANLLLSGFRSAMSNKNELPDILGLAEKFDLNTYYNIDDNKIYGFYLIESHMDNTLNSLNSTFINYTQNEMSEYTSNVKIYKYIDGKPIKNLFDYYNVLAPFANVNTLKQLFTLGDVISYPNIYNVNLLYQPTKLSEKAEEKTLAFLDESSKRSSKLQRYFESITPYLKKTNCIENQFNLKFKDIKKDILKLVTDSPYNNIKDPKQYLHKLYSIGDTAIYKEKLYITKYNGIRLYDIISNDEKDAKEIYKPLEYKSYNDNMYINLEPSFEIEINDSFDYITLLNYEKEKNVIKYFKNYINKNNINTYSDSEILFLYKKYHIDYLSEVVGLDITKSYKLYKLKYKFTLY